jgi:hypothetical protein
MDLETRRRALRAAAKVAFGAALAGALPNCGGKALVDSGASSTPSGTSPSGGSGAPSGDPRPAPSTTAPAGTATMAAADASASPDTGAPDAAPPDASTGTAGPRCLARIELMTPPAPQPSIADAEFNCCTSYANDRFASSSAAGEVAALGSDASFVNCCKAIIAGVDAKGWQIAANVSTDVRVACCFGNIVAPEIELYNHSYCSPWGPPVPPVLAAPGALEALA